MIKRSKTNAQRRALGFELLMLVRVMRGGGCRDRTDDPLLAKQVLSQLS